MTTLVGTEPNFVDAVKDLIELDYDAIEAYDAAINKLENKAYKEMLIDFKWDQNRHIDELSSILTHHGEEPPSGPSIVKQWLVKGKLFLGTLQGDKSILKAILSNKEDTNLAYLRMTKRDDKWIDIADTLDRGLIDEQSHKKLLENTINTFCKKTNFSPLSIKNKNRNS